MYHIAQAFASLFGFTYINLYMNRQCISIHVVGSPIRDSGNLSMGQFYIIVPMDFFYPIHNNQRGIVYGKE